MKTHKQSTHKEMNIVVIGGVAAGPKAASKIVRLCPDAKVTLIEKGKHLSYAGCGLPYYISGVVKEQKELMTTPVGTVRDLNFFKNVKNVRVLNHTEALSIDPQEKKVACRHMTNGQETWLGYDYLVIATGASPVRPPLPGIGLQNVFTLQKIENAERIKAASAELKTKPVTIVGGGLIGIEMAESLAKVGAQVTIVEQLPQILSFLDWEMARLLENYIKSKGVRVITNTAVQAIEGQTGVEAVVVNGERIASAMVILSVGVRPNVSLAQKAGLQIGKRGGIKVNEKMQTSDPDIYAVGDCVEVRHLLTNKSGLMPLGSTANKQGRVAAMNICGYEDYFPGVLNTAICKVFDYTVATTGLSEKAARDADYDTISILSPAPDKPHYYPGAKPIMIKLVVDRQTRKLLGAQMIGPGEVDKRIDTAATAITAQMTVDAIAQLDLAYAPPYSSAMDNFITAANVARNKLDGIFEWISPMEVKHKMEKGEDFLFLDVRSPHEYDEVRIDQAELVPLGKLRSKTSSLARDKEIITFCKISLRGYEAALILKANGFQNVKVMDGGLEMWPYEKIQVKT